VEHDKYCAILAEFDLLLAHARAIDAALVGRTPLNQNASYASEIWIKLLAHCVTVRSIAPNATQTADNVLWDLGSLSAIARCVIETYDAFSYISAKNRDDEEKAFRILLWELHDKNRRIRMLQLIGSQDVRLLEMIQHEQELHERAIGHPVFAKVTQNVRKKILARDPPDAYLSMRERCVESHIDYDYYNAATMQLSQYVHTFPFAIHQLFAFRGGSSEALLLMGLPLQYAMGFLSKASVELAALFSDDLPKPSPTVQRILELWCHLLCNGTKTSAA
jgi:hypothetical protein